ncbi:MAG: lipase family protein [Phycisphaerales bacterium]
MLDFNPHTTQFDHVNGLALGEAANLAYEDEDAITSKAAEWGMDATFIEDAPTDTQCFVSGGARAIFVAFRGTQPKQLQDVLTDAKIKQVVHSIGKVHEGFNDSFRSVWTDVRDQIRAYQTGGQSVWFTGHSLGAALAALATAEMMVDDRPVHGLYTFGQPRVGDPDFADRFNLRIDGRAFRYVNNNDIVTRVPPRKVPALNVEYSHVGAMKYFDSEGVLHEDRTHWLRFLDTVRSTFDDFKALLKETVGDHDMSLYLDNLERAARTPPPANDALGGLLGRLVSRFGR